MKREEVAEGASEEVPEMGFSKFDCCVKNDVVFMMILEIYISQK